MKWRDFHNASMSEGPIIMYPRTLVLGYSLLGYTAYTRQSYRVEDKVRTVED
jgi:hypothetical protein